MAPPAEKVKQAVAARKKGPRNWKLQYAIAIGGSVGSIIIAGLLLVVNPDKGPFQTPVNDQNLILHVNRNAKTWKAAPSAFFEGWTIGDVKTLQGTSVSAVANNVAPCVVPETPTPDSFDAREKWPQCFGYRLYNMGNCTASWAITAASTLSNRFCVSSPQEYQHLMLSPQQLLSCDAQNRGCGGGDIDTTWKYIQREGLVSEQCFSYQGDSTVPCGNKCQNEVPLKAASSCVLNSEVAIRREIFLNGPVVAPIFLVDDFLVYRSGLYQEMPTAKQLMDGRRQRIIHAVKIVGWGKVHGKRYWLIENSWGEDWGEDGYAKVIAGGDPDKREGIVIESYVLAGTPANKKMDFEPTMSKGSQGRSGSSDYEDIDGDLDEDIEVGKAVPDEDL